VGLREASRPAKRNDQQPMSALFKNPTDWQSFCRSGRFKCSQIVRVGFETRPARSGGGGVTAGFRLVGMIRSSRFWQATLRIIKHPSVQHVGADTDRHRKPVDEWYSSSISHLPDQDDGKLPTRAIEHCHKPNRRKALVALGTCPDRNHLWTRIPKKPSLTSPTFVISKHS
jgi:hypothetical protein